MTNLNEWFRQTRKVAYSRDNFEMIEIRPLLECKDGTTLSVQASYTHCSSPQDNNGPYTSVEVWKMSEPPSSKWLEYGDGENPYAQIPIELVEEYIDWHGGISE